VPSTEVCDGADNDCDSQIDEGNPGGGAACSTGQPGVCAAGTLTCQGGTLSCVPNVQAGIETCDGLDNDCDGAVDEGNPGGGAACSTGQPGVCAAGTLTCMNGGMSCVPNVSPGAELCNDALDNDCDGSVDEGCGGGSCTNIAPNASPSTSGGGSGSYGPASLNDGYVGCTAFCWISNEPSPAGAFFQYTWASAVTIGSFYVDGENATAPVCVSAGRDVQYAAVQWWNGSGWVTAGTVQGQENYMFTFPSPVTTTQLRLYDVTTSNTGQAANSTVFEWYVYSGTGCPVP
jgi:hypothetical protein